MWSPSQAAAQRAAKRTSAFYTDIDLLPFVGVMLVLLIIFMTTTPPLHFCLWCVDVPESLHAVPQPRALREDAMRVSVTRDGKFYFRDSPMAPEELPGLVRGALRDGAEKKIYLAVDARSRFGDTAAVVDQLQLAEITNICFITGKAVQQ